MVWATFTGTYFREVCRGNNLYQILIVEGEYFARNILNPWVDQVETIFSCVDVSDNSIVNINKSVFGHLHTC